MSWITQVYQKSDGRYGSPSMTVELQEQGIVTSRPRVARLMQKTGIRSIIRQKNRVQTTDSNHGHPVAENHLNQDFSAERLAQNGYLTGLISKQAKAGSTGRRCWTWRTGR